MIAEAILVWTLAAIMVPVALWYAWDTWRLSRDPKRLQELFDQKFGAWKEKQ